MNTPSTSHRIMMSLGLMLAGCSACGKQATAPEPAVGTQVASQAMATAQDPQGDLTAHLLIGESPKAVYSWTTATAQQREQSMGMVDDVVFGQRIFVRVAVTGLAEPTPFELQGSLELLAPDGRLLHEQSISGDQDDLDADAPGVLVLMPGMDIVFDPGDAVGDYHLSGHVTTPHQEHEVHRALRVADQGLQLDPAMEL